MSFIIVFIIIIGVIFIISLKHAVMIFGWFLPLQMSEIWYIWIMKEEEEEDEE